MSEHIIIEKGYLFLEMHYAKTEQSYKIPQGNMKLKAI